MQNNAGGFMQIHFPFEGQYHFGQITETIYEHVMTSETNKSVNDFKLEKIEIWQILGVQESQEE